MLSLIAGTVLLSIIHAAIPNHWMPLVLLGRSEGWTTGETAVITFVSGVAHSLSTVILGVLIGGIGYSLSREYLVVGTYIAPLVLIFMGVVYFSLDLQHRRHEHMPSDRGVTGRSRVSVVLLMALSMFLSPCLEIESYFFTAGAHGWQGIGMVALLYPVLSVGTMVLLVYLGRKSMIRWNLAVLDHHEKKITGFILIGLGIASYFLK